MRWLLISWFVFLAVLRPRLGRHAAQRVSLMAFVPRETAFGRLDEDYFEGVLTQSGKVITPMTTWLCNFDFAGGIDGDEVAAPIFLYNCYDADGKGGRHGAAFDGIWFTNCNSLRQECTEYMNAGIRNTIIADLNGDPTKYILMLGNCQAVKAGMLTKPCKVHFGDYEVEPAFRNNPSQFAMTCVGVGVANQNLRIDEYHSGMNDWVAIAALIDNGHDLIDNEVSPEPTVPFENSFRHAANAPRALPDVQFQYFLCEDGKGHSGARPGLILGVTYDDEESGLMKKAWLSGETPMSAYTYSAYHIKEPFPTSDIALPPIDVTLPYWERSGIYLGHRGLVPTDQLIAGGVPCDRVTGLIYITDFQGAIVLNKCGFIDPADVYTMSAMELRSADGVAPPRLHRLPSVDFMAVLAALDSALHLFGGFTSYGRQSAGRSILQQAMESQVSGKAQSLACKVRMPCAHPGSLCLCLSCVLA